MNEVNSNCKFTVTVYKSFDSENFLYSVRHIRGINNRIMQYRCCTDFFYCFRHFDTGNGRKLICQCCGMPIDDDSILGRDKDGTLNEEYCKWCYADGTYTYNDMDELIDVCVKNMVNENFTEEQVRSYLKEMLPKLDYWKRYDELSDNGQFEEFKKQLINEINDLHIDGLPKVDKLNALVGKYVNLEYTLPNGQKVKFLDDQKTYLGNQLESEFGGDRCFGILANMDFILVCTYEKDGENPELLIYKKR